MDVRRVPATWLRHKKGRGGGSQVQGNPCPSPILLGLPLPPDRGLAYFISCNRREGHSGVFTVSVSSHWRQSLGRTLQMPENHPRRNRARSISLPAPPRLRKQLFTWVRCSAGRAASS